jgi:hypothetical protein
VRDALLYVRPVAQATIEFDEFEFPYKDHDDATAKGAGKDQALAQSV